MLISFWHADTITSSDSSGLNNPTNLLNSTAYQAKKKQLQPAHGTNKTKDM
jgi:hypothetical protein